MSELPNGWALATLSDICKQPEQRVPQADEVFTYIDISSVDRDLKIVSEPQQLLGANAPSRARKLVDDGDVIVSMTRPNLNAVALIGEQHNGCIVSTGFDVLKPIGVEPRWIFSVVRSARFVDAMCEKVQGALYPAVKSADIREHKIPLPPLAEQTRIAQKLDELLAQVNTIKARIDVIPALLKRFRQSVLATSISGRLTEDWRENSTACLDITLNPKAKNLGMEELAEAEELLGEPLPSFWKKFALEQLVEPERGIPYGIVQTGNAVDKGVPTVRCGDVKNLFIDTSGLKVVSPEIEQDYKRTRLKGGEVLLAIRGSVGNVAVAPESLRDCNISREVAMIPTLPSVLPFYLACLLQSPCGQRLLVGKVRGVAQKGINLADVRRLPVALPPYDEQIEIVRRVELFFAFADQLEAKVASAKYRIDQLTQSILAKAFRGELVPQDPNDQPASELLTIIKAQRTATSKAAKRGRKTG